VLEAASISITRKGWIFLVAVALITISAYVLGHSLIFLLSAFFLAVFVYDGLLTATSASKARWRMRPLSPMFCAEKGRLDIEINNGNRRFPLMDFELHLESDLLGSASVRLGKLKAGSSTHAKLIVKPESRGMAKSRLVARSAYPFGFTQWRRVLFLADVRVYPRKLDEIPEILGRIQRSGGGRQVQSGDFQFLSDYQPGEDIRMIHWKKTASRQNPVVRRDVSQAHVSIPHLFIPDPCPHFEYALSALGTSVLEGDGRIRWAILGQQGVQSLNDKWDFMDELSTIQPLPRQPKSEDWYPFQAVYASTIQPVSETEPVATAH